MRVSLEEGKANMERYDIEELKSVHNNVMTIMENRIMSMISCDRKTANLIANEVLNLDRESDHLLSEK